MTAHELARKLLEGPDVPVVHAVDVDYGSGEEPCEISLVEDDSIWRFRIGNHWSDWGFGEPVGRTAPKPGDRQYKAVVRLR